MSAWAIREERPGDEAATAALTEAAFRDLPYSDGTEATIIERLRADGNLALSLVAEDSGGTIVGHAAFSPVTIAGEAQGWYGLGPLSVSPARQREGIGSALVRGGLERLAGERAAGCVVLGEPAYYGRFGFRHEPRLSYPGPRPEYFQMVAFADSWPEGTVRYAPAFG